MCPHADRRDHDVMLPASDATADVPRVAQWTTTGFVQMTRLLEREAELEQIGGALGRAAAGSGGIVVIEGAAGIGKSSLLGETAELAEAEGWPSSVRAALRWSGSSRSAWCSSSWRRCIEPLTDRERDRAFAGAAGLARPLFEEVPDRATGGGSPVRRFHGLHWLCARLAEERPLALLVDDAHWADEHSLRFLAYLAARIEEIPACAILAVRTGEAAAAPDALAELIEHEPRVVVRPPPLSPAAIAELVRGRLGEETEDDVCARVRPGDGREPAARASARRRARGRRERSTPARSPPWDRRRWPDS